MKEERDITTEQRILKAARKVFIEYGFNGARMQLIADEAGINKALLHYYFRSKEQLFDVVFTDLLARFQIAFFTILASDKPLIEKIRLMVEEDIELLMKHPEMPLFIISEVARNPEKTARRANAAKISSLFKEFSRQVKEGIAEGEIREVDPIDLLMNILSLNRFPFIGKPMIQSVIGLSDDRFQKLMKSRKRSVAELIIGDLKNRTTTGGK
ncbi:MAG: TetR/AcrR family transcriptional regulator [Ignavibacteriae bacterium]|nr:TetR/AcrR family transcriptional regulator [Ignavibacteriota bacterium]MCB9214539.1 TetR/AcrR family transcriptional regulator [Ignavibacteria bacterium]